MPIRRTFVEANGNFYFTCALDVAAPLRHCLSGKQSSTMASVALGCN